MDTKDRLNRLITTCSNESGKIKVYLKEIQKYKPFTEDVLANLIDFKNDNDIKLDALIESIFFRLHKLYISIENKIFPLVLELLLEYDHKTNIDRLNFFEKLSYIDSTSWWLGFNELYSFNIYYYENDLKELSIELQLRLDKIAEFIAFWEELSIKLKKLSSIVR